MAGVFVYHFLDTDGRGNGPLIEAQDKGYSRTGATLDELPKDTEPLI